jgi:Patatin-like phospholipase
MAPPFRHISSISFSGAGFYTVYHLGVAQCLINNHLLPPKPQKTLSETPTFTGVSGGALVSATLFCGIPIETSVQAILEVSRKARNFTFNIYQPGYSLIDVAEQSLLNLLREVEQGQLQERLESGRLRIGFTDSRVFPPFRYNPRAYRYIDSFQEIEDIVAACVLSSYVPGATGPLLSSSIANKAVQNSQLRLTRLSKEGKVKDFYGNSIAEQSKLVSPIFMDGGFVNLWPIIDNNTLIVTPLSATFPNHNHICPASNYSNYFMVNDYSGLAMDLKNVFTLQGMIWSSMESELEKRFQQGYDDAHTFLESKDLLKNRTFTFMNHKRGQTNQ